MSQAVRARIWSWLPPLIYMAVIFGFSSESNPLPEITENVWDKLLHTIEYAGLALLVCRALRRERVRLAVAMLVAVMFTSVYGATDEFHQWFVPGRSSDWHDWVADT